MFLGVQPLNQPHISAKVGII